MLGRVLAGQAFRRRLRFEFAPRSGLRTRFSLFPERLSPTNMKAPSASADIGLIGLAVMGENLVLNMESHGNTVAVFNRTTSKVDSFVNGRGKDKKIVGCHTV